MPVQLVLLGKPGCHLCEEMAQGLRRVLPQLGGSVEVREEDVRAHPALEKLYLFEIPVLLRGERVVARHRATDAELRRLLEAEASR